MVVLVGAVEGDMYSGTEWAVAGSLLAGVEGDGGGGGQSGEAEGGDGELHLDGWVCRQ